MRYTIAKENEVKKLAAEGKSLDYICSITGIPQKVVWGWCPELRPHDDVIKQSVKQRYHFMYPDYEAKISNAFSPYVDKNISEDDWEKINKVIYDTLYEESLYVFKNVITDPPDFGTIRNLSNERFIDYMKNFWSENSEYVISHNCSPSYIELQRNSVPFWSCLKNKTVKDITKGDIQIVHEKLLSKNLSFSRVTTILKTGLIPLKYAFNNGLTLLKTYEYNIPKVKKQDIKLDDLTISRIFNAKWPSEESYLANLISCFTGMKLQEVRALTLGDIYTDGKVVSSHIYTKHNEYIINKNAKVYFIPKQIIECILKYTSTSPYKDFKSTDFVFYSKTLNRQTPCHAKNWTKDLKEVSRQFSDLDISFDIWS